MFRIPPQPTPGDSGARPDAPASSVAAEPLRGRSHVAAVWGPPLVVAVLIAAVLAAVGRQQSARRWVAHTRDVLAAAQATLDHVQDAETGQRGYLLTGDTAYRAPYDGAHGALAADTARLRALTRDNADQQRRLDTLTPLIAAKVAELDATVRLRAAGDSAGALAVVRTDRGRHLMDAIRRGVHALTAEEDRLLVARQRREDVAATAVVLTVLAGGIAAGALALLANRLLAGGAARVARYARAEAARAEALAITQARLQRERGELHAANRELEARVAELEGAAAARERRVA